MILSDNLKIIRKENNLSQEQLAEKLGVSRQAVSKWESGQSYPEMDKVLLICKLFNYNIDELMNENIKEVSEAKQSKININKYIDDFFEFITKTVDMFSVMKFRQKLKCFSEQIFIIIFLVCIFFIIGELGSVVLSGLIERLPDSIYYTIFNIFKSIYIVLALVVGITILLHIFKVRYLDYYDIIKENNTIENENDDEETIIEKTNSKGEKKKLFIRKEKQKIIIRDPEHSQSKFLTGIIKVVLWCIKFVAVLTAICFVFSFIGITTLLVLSFLFIKTGAVFFGSLLVLLSALITNFIILECFFNFIISKKSKRTRIALMLVISLIFAGIGIGLILIGVTEFNYVEEPEKVNILEDSFTTEMTENLSINDSLYDRYIEYIDTDINEIKITVKHSKYYKPYFNNHNETIYIYHDNTKVMENIRDIIKDINNKQILNYFCPKMYVYASKDNIEKMKQNRDKKIDELNTLYEIIEDKDLEIFDLQNESIEKDVKIESLEQELKSIKSIQKEDSEIILNN